MTQSSSAPGASSYPLGQASGAKLQVASAIDRWMFVFMAGLFTVTVLVGFVPDSIGLVQAVRTGVLPPLPAALHVHAVVMGSWILLLLGQTTLVATGRTALHRQLGLVGVVLAPAMVIAGMVVVPTMLHYLWGALKTAPPPLAAQLKSVLSLLYNTVLEQVRVGIVFPTLVGLALVARRTDSGLHKRLMILATVLPLIAAVDRIGWLPTTLPANPTGPELYTLLWISPMLGWDLYRSGRVHRAYWIWLGANAPFLVAEHAFWGTPWWLATVPKLMGIS
jgi:hypothetical protein